MDESSHLNALFDSYLKHNNCAIDVFWKEPYNGLISNLKQNNVSMTPHLASTCNEFLISAEEDFYKFLQTL